eukprot:2562013-Pyramimonas_sp.AAC.1
MPGWRCLRRRTSRCLLRRAEEVEVVGVEEDMGLEADVLLAASGRDPRFSVGALQRGIPVPRCCH